MVSHFKKNKTRKNPHSPLTVFGGILILGIVVALTIANIKMYHRKQLLNAKIETLEQKITTTKNKNSDLGEMIQQEHNDAYTEKIAREELDLQQPGEKVFSFITTPKENNGDNARELNIFQTWLNNINNWLKQIF